MFVTTVNEIKECVATSRWKRPEKLLRYIEDCELRVLTPLLGSSLLRWLEAQYGTLTANGAEITSEAIPSKPVDMDAGQWKTIRLIRQVQSVVIYRMLADKILTLSFSLNEGGGQNRMSADGYDEASVSDIKEVQKDYFRDSIRSTENILLLLEQDAEDDTPLFREKWEESEFYYVHEGLLFPTIRSTQGLLDFGDSRQDFHIKHVPTIRYCQETYIEPKVGSALVAHILHGQMEDEALRSHLVRMLRSALSHYVLAQGDKEHWTERMSAGDNAIQIASEYIKSHQAELDADVMKTSPLYIPTEEHGECPCPPHPHKNGKYHHFATLGVELNRS